MSTHDLTAMYEGVFEEWKTRLAFSRIRALGLPRSDWPDLMQDLAMLILKFEFDPDNATGASEVTALYAAINRHLLMVLRQRYRERDGFMTYLRSFGVREDGTYLGPDPCYEVDPDLKLDFAGVVSRLSDFDRKVAIGLAAGTAIAELARRLDCEWNTVQKAVGRIRRTFEELGYESRDAR